MEGTTEGGAIRAGRMSARMSIVVFVCLCIHLSFFLGCSLYVLFVLIYDIHRFMSLLSPVLQHIVVELYFDMFMIPIKKS